MLSPNHKKLGLKRYSILFSICQRYTCSIDNLFHLSVMDVIYLQSDPATLRKCLTIAHEMLKDKSVKTMTPSLLTLMETLVSCYIIYVPFHTKTKLVAHMDIM